MIDQDLSCCCNDAKYVIARPAGPWQSPGTHVWLVPFSCIQPVTLYRKIPTSRFALLGTTHLYALSEPQDMWIFAIKSTKKNSRKLGSPYLFFKYRIREYRGLDQILRCNLQSICNVIENLKRKRSYNPRCFNGADM